MELSSDADHATTVSALAAKIGLDDPTPIQLQRSSLASMLGRTQGSRPCDSNVLYYKLLDSSSSRSHPPEATPAATDPSSPLGQLIELFASDREGSGKGFLLRLASSGQHKDVLEALLKRWLVESPDASQLESSQDLGSAMYVATEACEVESLGVLLQYASSSLPLAKE